MAKHWENTKITMTDSKSTITMTELLKKGYNPKNYTPSQELALIMEAISKLS